ncbi:MAG: hypothetical protein C6H99_03000 [Epsilonproteobacteria bacterium]|nr:hypothetical protein [Campylobacterota bacterium]NPA63664.1 pimelyl-ACP methyl ester esterase BioV [Campylobacterota bacterium]
MVYFSGLGFRYEQVLFREYLDGGDFVVAGFSYGAQKACVEALKRIDRGERIQKLQLLSPAYFDDMDEALKKKEIAAFVKNKEAYMRFFYKKALYPALDLDISRFQREPALHELQEVLHFHWRRSDLKRLQESGVDIEIYLGELDKIVNTKLAHRFFKEFGTSYLIKGVGHLLKEADGKDQNRRDDSQ